MNIKSIKEYIFKAQNQATQYRAQAKSLEQKADSIEQEIPGLEKALELLDPNITHNINDTQSNKEKKTRSPRVAKRQKPSCRGNVRAIYEIMKKHNGPISAIEIYKRSKNESNNNEGINQNTISGTLSLAYNKKNLINRVADGLYQINEKGLKLLEDTKDDDVKRDI